MGEGSSPCTSEASAVHVLCACRVPRALGQGPGEGVPLNLGIVLQEADTPRPGARGCCEDMVGPCVTEGTGARAWTAAPCSA